ncbi:MAG: universal stress protein, partial [Acidobacteria bacterium]|nr:universal stress protein [Acidobacteriota bacterium]
MLKFERILCPLDFSEFSTKAYEYAQSLARHYEAKLILAHIVQPVFSAYPSYLYPDMVNDIYHDLRAHAEEQLKQFATNRHRDGVKVVNEVREGAVTDTILALAQAEAVDLIVMGTHGRHGFDHMLLGSVTEKVLRKASCPVLAVRAHTRDFVASADPEDPVHLRKILFGTDFSAHSERALEYALSLAAEYSAELMLLNVLEEIPPSSDLSTVTAEVVRQLEA